jgi:hypothetical protein
MITLKKIIVGSALLLILAIAVFWIPVFGFHKPYVNWAPWDLAEYLVKHDRPAQECFDLIWFEIMAPSQAEQRALCVFEYAQRSKQSSICNLLLPSEYGLACISNLWPEVLPDDGCGWNIKDPNIYECRPRGGSLVQSSDCADFSSNTKQFSACLYEKAEREWNPSKCADVPDPLIRSFCETRINAWVKYPQLRGSSYFGETD